MARMRAHVRARAVASGVPREFDLEINELVTRRYADNKRETAGCGRICRAAMEP
jgi:hypothetical protein